MKRAVRPSPGAPLTACELGILSQNGEDGVLQALLEQIGSQTRYFVELGAGRGEQSTCALLANCLRWSGLFIESDAEAYSALESKYRPNSRVATRNASVTPGNVEAIFTAVGVPATFDVMSIDIDGNDYWVWQAIEAFAARVVVVEYNANLALEASVVMPTDDRHTWDETDYFGASLGALRALGAEKGYELVHTDSTGVNAFFVRQTEARSVVPRDGVPLHGPNYLGSGLRHPRDPTGRPFVDLDTGQLVQAPRQP